MNGFTFDSNIIVDALAGYDMAKIEIRRAVEQHGRVWTSRMVWVDVLSKGTATMLRRAETLLSGFEIDEIDAGIARTAASLRRQRPRLKSPDAIILATAQLRGRILVTRNTKDFPAEMPGIRAPYIL